MNVPRKGAVDLILQLTVEKATYIAKRKQLHCTLKSRDPDSLTWKNIVVGHWQNHPPGVTDIS